MSTITRERTELKAFITGFLSDPMHDDESAKSMTAEVFRIALASLEAEPVPGLFIKCTNIEPRPGEVTIAQATPMANGEYHDSCFHLYASPPAPVSDSLLSELLSIAKRAADEADECAHAEFSDDSMEHSAAIVDWERRAAMLQGASDRWVACSERMPEDKQYEIWLFDGKSVHYGYTFDGGKFNDWRGEDWEPLEGVTHWMPMTLPAVPQQEV